MKKTLFILLFIITSICVKAQTKEETIAWLKEKLKSNLASSNSPNVTLESISECEFTIYYVSDDGSLERRFTLPTNDIKIDITKGEIWFNSKVIKVNDLKRGINYSIGSTSFEFYIDEREENIRWRIRSALEHLATFCPKKTEAF